MTFVRSPLIRFIVPRTLLFSFEGRAQGRRSEDSGVPRAGQEVRGAVGAGGAGGADPQEEEEEQEERDVRRTQGAGLAHAAQLRQSHNQDKGEKSIRIPGKRKLASRFA